MATTSRVATKRNGHSRDVLDLGIPFPGAVGGPVKRPWREGTLTRAAEIEALAAWMRRRHGNGNGRGADDVEVLGAAIARHLGAARDATCGRGWLTRDGSRLQRAMSNLDAAEADLLNLAPDNYVLGQMPGLLNHVQRHLPRSDPRRQGMERIAQAVGVKDPEHPRAQTAELSLNDKKQ